MPRTPRIQEVDACGLLCPLPVLKVRKRLMGMQRGDLLRLRTTDPAAVIDIPHFCHEAGHELLESTSEDAETIHMIRCGGSSGC